MGVKRPALLSQAHFEHLARTAPAELAALLRSDLPAVYLTFAAEAAGAAPREVVGEALEALLQHRDPVVREGAEMGLGALRAREELV